MLMLIFLFLMLIPNVTYSQAPVYFDFSGAIIWVFTIIIVSLSLKPRVIFIPIAIILPFVYSAIEDVVRVKMNYIEDVSRYEKATELCKNTPDIKVNKIIELSTPPSIRYNHNDLYNDGNLLESNSCWNSNEPSNCSSIYPCWLTGSSCKASNVSALELAYGPKPIVVYKIKIPIPPKLTIFDAGMEQEQFTTPYELRYIKVEDIVPYSLSRFDLQLKDTTTNEILSHVNIIFFYGRDSNYGSKDEIFNKPSFSCPDRDKSVVELFSKTFKISKKTYSNLISNVSSR